MEPSLNSVLGVQKINFRSTDFIRDSDQIPFHKPSVHNAAFEHILIYSCILKPQTSQHFQIEAGVLKKIRPNVALKGSNPETKSPTTHPFSSKSLFRS